MPSAVPLLRLLPLLLGVCPLLGCADQNNRVVGGANTVPPLIIRAVGSSIFAQVTATDTDGGVTTANAVVLSENENLCATLAQKPDLFQSTDTAFVAIILLTPPDRLGSFYFMPGGAVAGTFSSSYGTGIAPLVWAGVGGTISLGEFDSSSKATGNFDVVFADTRDNRVEVYGVFKSEPCPALARAWVPRVP